MPSLKELLSKKEQDQLEEVAKKVEVEKCYQQRSREK